VDVLVQNVRQLVFKTLELLSSAQAQLQYQGDVPWVNVADELFCQWQGAYVPGAAVNQEAFSRDELEVLNEFQLAFDDISSNTPTDLPSLIEFMQTAEWSTLSEAASLALSKLASIGTHNQS
jgi:hypothetical protein